MTLAELHCPIDAPAGLVVGVVARLRRDHEADVRRQRDDERLRQRHLGLDLHAPAPRQQGGDRRDGRQPCRARGEGTRGRRRSVREHGLIQQEGVALSLDATVNSINR